MVHICLEALIRLFFEIVRVLFGDVTLIWQGSYLESELPALLSTLKWILFFTILAMVVKNKTLRNVIVIGVPAVVNLSIDALGLIPYIGSFFAIGVGIAGVPIAALAWAFVLWVDDKVHPLLKIFATPGVMLCAAVNAVQPASVFGDFGFALALSYAPEIVAFFGIIAIGIIIVISPTWLCSALNKVLIVWEGIRYEGWKAAVLGSLVFVKNKAVNIRYKF